MKRDLGAFGESWAVGQLTRQGYRIVDRNVRYRVGEIDIVAHDGDDLVFVEVKCRRGDSFGSPQASITPSRYGHLAAAIEEYLAANLLAPDSYRIDVVAIRMGAKGQVTNFEVLKGVEPGNG